MNKIQKACYQSYAETLKISKSDSFWGEMGDFYIKSNTLGLDSEIYWVQINELMVTIKKKNIKYWPLIFRLIYENILRLQDNYENPLLPKALKVNLEKIVREAWLRTKSDKKLNQILFRVLQPILADLKISLEK